MDGQNAISGRALLIKISDLDLMSGESKPVLNIQHKIKSDKSMEEKLPAFFYEIMTDTTAEQPTDRRAHREVSLSQ